MNLDNLDLNKSGAFIIGLSDCGEKITSAGGRVSTQEGTVLGIWQNRRTAKKCKAYRQGYALRSQFGSGTYIF